MAGRIVILIPVFNDWDPLAILLPKLDNAVGSTGLSGDVVLVDDGSTVPLSEDLRHQNHKNLSSVKVVRLRCNLGHQRAIAVGLAHLCNTSEGVNAIVVMDGDGEDKPEDVPLLLAELAQTSATHVVFAARTKRFEPRVFRLMYHLYRIFHWLLTGVAVRVGNFSVLRSSALSRLLATPDLWNHYAAAVFRSRLPFSTLPLSRGRRYCGQSQMRYSSLVSHGLSAIAVFSDIVGARLILCTSGIIALSTALLFLVAIVRLFTTLAIPGWATTAGGLLIVVLMQSLLSLLVLMFIVLGNRSQARIIPLRDAEAFVERVEPLR